MIETGIIKALRTIGLGLIIYSCYLLAFDGALLSRSGIEYGIILFGISCTAQAIQAKRLVRSKTKNGR